MAPRDEHDYNQRRQQIIEGALRVFADKGFEKATNKDIAQAAGIGSPGLIYHYFADKDDLFQRVLEHHLPIFRILEQGERIYAMPPHEALLLITHTIFGVLNDPIKITFIKLTIGEAIRRPELADLVGRLLPGRGLRFLSNYFEYLMDQGVLRRAEPRALARTFIGAILAYIITVVVFKQPDLVVVTPEVMAQTLVDTFLNGALVERAQA
ncbi:MAG: TetR/AcrR family transcriptional regulator [Chloroflexaceae bacterium]|nr:TetR/AcrR family transcriptional regulator [Chloroflexaceae bacterium]NJL33220.1 TetR/AcrR family transcriptional regulator [Chloroflexaceae bacterium]NJO05531.1 TetR/AcrR family transcriptional regulator [Chloroflexaceae bacterium]